MSDFEKAMDAACEYSFLQKKKPSQETYKDIYMEGAHRAKEWCDEQKTKTLPSEIVELILLIKDVDRMQKITNYIVELQAKLDKAVEALKKYADINNWCDSRDSYQHIVFMDGEDLERVYPQGEKSKKVMGKIARETLAELEADNAGG